MIEITDIIRETLAENESNAYYWDAVNYKCYLNSIGEESFYSTFK